MKTIKEIQEEHKYWAYRNFGNQPAWVAILGMTEELGELTHHYLKRLQNIRLNEDHDAGIEDSVGDFLVYLCQFCTSENIDIEEVLNKTWESVKQRDWSKNKTNGQANP